MSQDDVSEKWTIYDIAREAGITAKTVSRALNGKPGVSEATRKRVAEIVNRVGYHPHLGARTLRSRSGTCIGLTLPAPMSVVPVSQGFFIWLFEELYRVFGMRGDYVCFDLNPYSGKGPGMDYARGLWDGLYKACIIAGALAVDDTVIHAIHRSGAPYLALGRLDSLPECSSATVDYEEGAYLCTKQLIQRGHRRVAMLKAFSGFQPSVERVRGYRRALEEAGLPWDERLVRSVKFGARNIANVVHRLLADSGVTALVDSSATENASGLREGARRAGRTPGRDFEIIAWTYMDQGAVLREAVGHLWLPVREAASEGLERLTAWVDGKTPGPIQVLYRPVILNPQDGLEIPEPKRIFELKE